MKKIPIMLLPCLALLVCSHGGDSDTPTTPSSSSIIFDILTDERDGKTYKWTMMEANMGAYGQYWMVENLNYEAAGSKCYNDDPANCDKYGRLYDWKTAKTACPNGWHIPSDAAWEKFTTFAGGSLVAGKTLKSKTEWGWDKGGGGTDDYGFSALPGGSHSNGDFSGINESGGWWSSSENGNEARTWIISAASDYLTRAYYLKSEYMFSVRCVGLVD